MAAHLGGVGERAAEVRGAVLRGMGWMGLDVDKGPNATAVPDAEIHPDGLPGARLCGGHTGGVDGGASGARRRGRRTRARGGRGRGGHRPATEIGGAGRDAATEGTRCPLGAGGRLAVGHRGPGCR